MFLETCGFFVSWCSMTDGVDRWKKAEKLKLRGNEYYLSVSGDKTPTPPSSSSTIDITPSISVFSLYTLVVWLSHHRWLLPTFQQSHTFFEIVSTHPQVAKESKTCPLHRNLPLGQTSHPPPEESKRVSKSLAAGPNPIKNSHLAHRCWKCELLRLSKRLKDSQQPATKTKGLEPRPQLYLRLSGGSNEGVILFINSSDCSKIDQRNQVLPEALRLPFLEQKTIPGPLSWNCRKGIGRDVWGLQPQGI